MIITKTPFRVSFAGGGSDLESFYKRSYGAVVSTTISKYMYIMIHPYFHDKLRIKYSKLEDVESINKIKHPIVREALKLLRIDKGVEIASIADVPAGTGIGSSSSFTVGLLHALYAYKGKFVTKEKLAADACRIEIDILGEPIGKQDQYAASFGNLNFIRFAPCGRVTVEPIVCKPQTIRTLEKNLLMFYVGGVRSADKILKQQSKKMNEKENYQIVRQMVKLAEELKEHLEKGRIESVGSILHQGWQLKKRLVKTISNRKLQTYYKRAQNAGALGGKLLGAGATGFFLFYCEPKNHNKLRKTLGLRELKFNFESEGSKIIYLGENVRR